MMQIRAATLDDEKAIYNLYRKVASRPGGLARLQNEIDPGYIRDCLNKALTKGIALVAVTKSGAIAGEMHAYRPGLFCFSHVLSDLTIVVDPEQQGSGLGRQLFTTFIQQVVEQHADITRIELIVRESNRKAIDFYRSLGFVKEGAMAARIKNTDGSLEADIPMAWQR